VLEAHTLVSVLCTLQGSLLEYEEKVGTLVEGRQVERVTFGIHDNDEDGDSEPQRVLLRYFSCQVYAFKLPI